MNKFFALFFLFVSLTFANTRPNIWTMCPSGCNYTTTQLDSVSAAITAGTIVPGDFVVLTAGNSYSTSSGGTWFLPVIPSNPNNLYITFRTSGLGNLPANTRIAESDPNLATVTTTFNSSAYFPLQISQNGQGTTGGFGCWATGSATVNLTCNTGGPGYYAFEGIKFAPNPNSGVTALIQMGYVFGGTTADHEKSQLPHNIIFDRCEYAGHGPGNTGVFTDRAISMNAVDVSVTNSYFYEEKEVLHEAQDIVGWNGFGPYRFINNHFEASAMSTLFGGAQIVLPINNAKAQDLQFRGNEYYKPWDWRMTVGNGPPSTVFSSSSCHYDSRGGEWYADNSSGGSLYNCVSGTWTVTTEAAWTANFDSNGAFTTGTSDPTGGCIANKPYYKNTSTPSYWVCTTNQTGGVWVNAGIGAYYGGYCGTSSCVTGLGDYGAGGLLVQGVSMAYYEKNLWEEKDASRSIVEGNFLHNSWVPTALNQHGACFLINQVDNPSPGNWDYGATINNFEIRYNQCDWNPWGVSIGVLESNTVSQQYLVNAGYGSIHDNVFSHNGDLDNSFDPSLSGGTSGTMVGVDNITIQWSNATPMSFTNNTMFTDLTTTSYGSQATSVIPVGSSQNTRPQITNFVDNILQWGVSKSSNGDAGFYGYNGGGNLYNSWDTNNDWTRRGFSKNVVVNNGGALHGSTDYVVYNIATASSQGSFRKACPDCAGVYTSPSSVPQHFDNGGVSDVGFNSFSTGDYSLKSSSPYKNWGLGGVDPGADIPMVNEMTAHALDGVHNPMFDFNINYINPSTTSANFVYQAPNTSTCTVTISLLPNLSSPITATDSGGMNTSRSLTATGLTTKTRYYYSLACSTYQRDGQFRTN